MSYLEKLLTIYVSLEFLFVAHSYFRDRKLMRERAQMDLNNRYRLHAEQELKETTNLLKRGGTFTLSGKTYEVKEKTTESALGIGVE